MKSSSVVMENSIFSKLSSLFGGKIIEVVETTSQEIIVRSLFCKNHWNQQITFHLTLLKRQLLRGPTYVYFCHCVVGILMMTYMYKLGCETTVKPVVCATSTSAPPVYPSQFISVPMPSPLQMTCASAPPVYARHAPPFLGPISKSILSKRATMHGSS